MAQGPLAAFVRRRERTLIAVWLAGCVLLVTTIAVVGVGMGGAERVIDKWTYRGLVKLDRGRELVEAGRLEEAAVYLERLDGDFPARWNRHRFDRAREELLELLGRSYAGLDRKRRCLETFERLVAFDPRNWNNHFLLAEHRRLFGEPELAAEAYAEVLAVHPNHLPSVRAVIDARFESGQFTDVVAAFETYVDAWLLAQMTLSAGDFEAALEVAADGRTHTVELPFEVTPEAGELCLATGGYSVRLESVELLAPLIVGVAAPRTSITLTGDGAWTATDAERVSSTTWSAGASGATLCSALPGGDFVRAHVTLAAYKALPQELLETVRKSYSNALDTEGWAAMRERLVVGGCLEAGSLFAR